jgi:hypothetical protein
MRGRLISTPLMLSVSLMFLLAGREASFAAASANKCDMFLVKCTSYCFGEYEDEADQATCQGWCSRRLVACYRNLRTRSGFPVNPNPPPKWTDPGRVKPPPLKGTDNPPKRTGPGRVPPPQNESNPSGGSPPNNTVFERTHKNK